MIEIAKEIQTPEVTNKALGALLNQYKNIFEEPLRVAPIKTFDHAISLTKENVIVNIRPYRYSFHQKNEIEKQVQKMLDESPFGHISLK